MHDSAPEVNGLVLVVDDDPSVRKALHRLLRSAGLAVEVFASGSELLAFERPPRPTCLVLDLHLPGLDGLDLLRRIVAEAPDLPVAVLTGEADPGLKARVLRAGARTFLAKPFEESRLLKEVRRLLAG
jgi:FixJ family two-component response regulator